jgi:hypothetical protein
VSGFITSEDMAAEIDYSAGILPGTTRQADPSMPGVAGATGVSLGTGTGSHGSVGVDTGDNTMGEGIAAVVDWINRPFTTPMSKTDVFLLVGTVLFAIVAWNFILYHIRIAAESI